MPIPSRRAQSRAARIPLPALGANAASATSLSSFRIRLPSSCGHSEAPAKRPLGTRMNSLLHRAVGVLVVFCVGLLPPFALADKYEYDSLGRLVRVVHDDNRVTDYILDAAGNRTTVTTAASQGIPGTLQLVATA